MDVTRIRPVLNCGITPRSMHITLISAHCNVSFYLEIGSEFVISKSEDYLAVLFFAFS